MLPLIVWDRLIKDISNKDQKIKVNGLLFNQRLNSIQFRTGREKELQSQVIPHPQQFRKIEKQSFLNGHCMHMVSGQINSTILNGQVKIKPGMPSLFETYGPLAGFDSFFFRSHWFSLMSRQTSTASHLRYPTLSQYLRNTTEISGWVTNEYVWIPDSMNFYEESKLLNKVYAFHYTKNRRFGIN